MSAKPEGRCAVDADGETNGRVLAKAANPSSVAQCAVCRQTPKVGAECPNWACSDLCGGRSVMSVPTANAKTRRRLKRRPNFEAYSLVERKKSRKTAVR